MNKSKNKTLYRLIPIKVTNFFSVKSRELFFIFVVLTLKNTNSVICLSILSVFYIYTIIYSFKFSFKPEWVSFFCWTYMLFWRMWKTKQFQQLFGYPRSSK